MHGHLSKLFQLIFRSARTNWCVYIWPSYLQGMGFSSWPPATDVNIRSCSKLLYTTPYTGFAYNLYTSSGLFSTFCGLITVPAALLRVYKLLSPHVVQRVKTKQSMHNPYDTILMFCGFFHTTYFDHILLDEWIWLEHPQTTRAHYMHKIVG